MSSPGPSVPPVPHTFPDLVQRGEELAMTGSQTWVLLALGAVLIVMGAVLALSSKGGSR